jgi:hypothetical protein
MMGIYPVRPEVDVPLIRSIFGHVGVPAATSILQNREISYIGINELVDEITIFTRKKLSAREERMFQNITLAVQSGSIAFTFMQSALAHVGKEPEPPVGIPPLHSSKGPLHLWKLNLHRLREGRGDFGVPRS